METKTKNLISYTVAILFVVALVAFIGFGDKATTPDSGQLAGETVSAGVLSLSEDFFDFGTISMADGDVTHEFTISNNGPEAVVIGKVYTSCACTTAFITDAGEEKYGKFGMQGHSDVLAETSIEIGAGESVTLEAVYNPAKHGPAGVGLAQRSIYIESNSSETPRIEAAFQAVVTR